MTIEEITEKYFMPLNREGAEMFLDVPGPIISLGVVDEFTVMAVDGDAFWLLWKSLW
jgi:hypothetical protein